MLQVTAVCCNVFVLLHCYNPKQSQVYVTETVYTYFTMLSPILCSAPAANGHSDCLRMMIDYGEEGDLTNVVDKFDQ